MARIFISYRRDDAGYVASMVRERLETEFGAGAVFMDIDNIPLGVDFRQHLSDAVATCDVLVALIGETWAGPLAGDTQQRRIDDPQDFVRIEIEAALKRGIPVVPVLIDKAQLPAVQSLPETLRELAFRNAAELRAGRDLNAHLDTLSLGLRRHLSNEASRMATAGTTAFVSPSLQGTRPENPAPSAASVVAPVTAATHTPLHPASASASATPPAAPPRKPMVAIAGGAALFLAAAVGWWALGRPADGGPQTPALVPGPVLTATVESTRPSQATPTTPAQGVTVTPTAVAPAKPVAPADTPALTQPPPAEPDSAAADPSLLDGYKIAIFYLAGDTAAGQTARAIRDALATRGVRRGVELRLATAQRMRELIPPDGLEVRFDEGREDGQARLLAKLLAARPLRLAPTLRPVPADEPTPNFISVFVPSGG